MGSDHLSILLAVPLFPIFHLNKYLPSIFRKLVGMTLLFTLTLIVLFQRNTRLFHLLLFFTSLALNGLLTIWSSGLTALFLLAKAAMVYLPTALSVALRPLFLAGPVCSSFSAEACSNLLPLCWSWQHHQVCHFFSPI